VRKCGVDELFTTWTAVVTRDPDFRSAGAMMTTSLTEAHAVATGDAICCGVALLQSL